MPQCHDVRKKSLTGEKSTKFARFFLLEDCGLIFFYHVNNCMRTRPKHHRKEPQGQGTMTRHSRLQTTRGWSALTDLPSQPHRLKEVTGCERHKYHSKEHRHKTTKKQKQLKNMCHSARLYWVWEKVSIVKKPRVFQWQYMKKGPSSSST